VRGGDGAQAIERHPSHFAFYCTCEKLKQFDVISAYLYNTGGSDVMVVEIHDIALRLSRSERLNPLKTNRICSI
jgi:hypothetical protein